ncbi:MAG: UDP-N-acetylmuramate--L-alanine ligase [Actinomycetota bacterium]|nr:UDP-N-acetylmuramate--L-alanine ligase [Actinomycetota bacterium]
MSGIARILLARGVPVSGSDAKDSAGVQTLRSLGAVVTVGHDAANLGDAETVVVSSAIRRENREYSAALSQGLRVLPRAAALAAVMAGSTAVAVAGTHGKTTTTSMLTVALRACGTDPSFAIGGDLAELGTNAHAGAGRFFVAEADESDGSFLLLSPDGAVVTNVEPDHLDHYADAAAVDEAFRHFLGRIRPGGFLVCCADDPGARRLADAARDSELRVLTYGESPAADLRLTDMRLSASGVSYRLTGPSQLRRAGGTAPPPAGVADPAGASRIQLGEVVLTVPGRHNALNAAAALAAGLLLDQAFDSLVAGLAGFTGARRRFEAKGEAGGVRVYDDYAHHPTEIAATLTAARDVAAGGRLVVAFQPHRYSRTLAFRDQFGAALALADAVVVLEVYSAGEDPIAGASGASVAAAVPLPAGDVHFEASLAAAPAELARRARPGDLVLTLGAGDITTLAPAILTELSAGAADQRPSSGAVR